VILVKKFFKLLKNDKSGELTIEAMAVTIPTIFVMIFLLSLGFLLYQHWNMQIAVDNTTSKIAGTYATIKADNKTGEISAADYMDVACYRNLQVGFFGSAGNYLKSNQQRTTKYVKERMNSLTFATPVSEPIVDVKVVNDAYARKHLSVKVQADYRIPFCEGLEILGMKGTRTYKVNSNADCIDMLDYLNAVKMAEVAPTYIKSDIASAVTEWMKVIQSVRNFGK
jgi:hypothetical protein